MKGKRKSLRIHAAWALSAFAAAAAAHYADCPERGKAWFEAIEHVEPITEETDRLATVKELKRLPTWSLQAVAEAAAKIPFQTKRTKCIASGLMTEFQRRRTKAQS